MRSVWSHLGISGDQALAVVVATVILYSMFVVALRVWGRPLKASTSTVSVAAATVMGSLVGRSMLGDVPDLSGGLIAFTTLVVLETTARRLRLRTAVTPELRRPVVVIVAGRIDTEALAGTGTSEPELAVLLRRQGVLTMSDVALAVLETDGGLTVVPEGRRIDAPLLGDVQGAADLPDALVRREPRAGTTPDAPLAG